MYKEFFGISEQSDQTQPIHTAIGAYTNMAAYTDETKKSEIRKEAESLARRDPGLTLQQLGSKHPNMLYFTLSGNKEKAIQSIKSLREKYTMLDDVKLKFPNPVKTDTDGFELDEAQLINNITDYKGGVIYKLFDPSTYSNVRADIESFAKKRGLRVIQNKFNSSKGIGYMRFTQSDDLGKDSQRIQGFISQLPEVSKFKFKVISKNNN